MPSLLRIQAVVAKTGLSRSEIYRRRSAGTFPQPAIISGTRIRAWDSEAIDAWVAQALALSPRAGETPFEEND